MNQLEVEESGEPCLWEMNYEPSESACKHPLPGDWHFAGATGEDPRADPRWAPVTYTFLDRMLHRITLTQEPKCRHEAVGSYRDRVNARGREVFYVVATPPSGVDEIIYSDVTGAIGAGRD